MSTNVMVIDLDIAPPHRSDLHRLEVVGEGLTLFGRCQLAIDATVVSPFHSDGTHRRKADDTQVEGQDIPRVVPARRARAMCGGWRGRGEDGPMKRRRWCGPCLACAKAASLPRSDVGAVFWRVPQGSRFIPVGGELFSRRRGSGAFHQ